MWLMKMAAKPKQPQEAGQRQARRRQDRQAGKTQARHGQDTGKTQTDIDKLNK